MISKLKAQFSSLVATVSASLKSAKNQVLTKVCQLLDKTSAFLKSQISQ